MTARRIIPCLDVRDGRVVKGVRFEGHVDMGDAADLAARYRDQGADELVFYDITASPEGRTLDYGWVRDIARLLDIPFSVAGGIRSVDQAALCLDHGADKVSINSPALERPDLIGEMAGRFGSQCVEDGVRRGYDIAQLAAARALLTIPLVASGGAGAASHFRDVFEQADVSGALAASVFHTGTLTIPDLKAFLSESGQEMRL